MLRFVGICTSALFVVGTIHHQYKVIAKLKKDKKLLLRLCELQENTNLDNVAQETIADNCSTNFQLNGVISRGRVNSYESRTDDDLTDSDFIEEEFATMQAEACMKTISSVQKQVNITGEKRNVLVNPLQQVGESKEDALPGKSCCSISPKLIERYSRHMILPKFGPSYQQELVNASVLIVGAGGLAATLAPLLAAAGVGHISIIDDDIVETSNLQRQIMYSEASANSKMFKAIALKKRLLELNSNITCTAIVDRFSIKNALNLVKGVTVVVDATDNLGTRYLINDACVLNSVPFVSGAAQGYEGQLSVYYSTPWQQSTSDSNETKDSKVKMESNSCYRCLFSEPPSTNHQGNCNDNGVLSPVPGVIGCLQALETIKVIMHTRNKLDGTSMMPLFNHLLMVDMRDLSAGFMKIKKNHSRRESCLVCGPNANIKSVHDTLNFLEKHELSCFSACAVKFPKVPSVSVEEYLQYFIQNENHILLDVRSKEQFEIGALSHAVNFPFDKLKSSTIDQFPKPLQVAVSEKTPIYVVCRRGIDSRFATKLLENLVTGSKIVNVSGGLTAWAEEIDSTFPKY